MFLDGTATKLTLTFVYFAFFAVVNLRMHVDRPEALSPPLFFGEPFSFQLLQRFITRN